MSDNPEAFEYLRKAAYGHVKKYGKDRWQLLDFCKSSILRWVKDEGSDLGESEALRLAADVTRWTVEKYHPPRKKPVRSQAERAAAKLLAPHSLELAAEEYGAATVRNAARISGDSKSTVARHLREQGISPKRQKRIDALPARVKWLAHILDETFRRDGAGIVLVDDLVAVIWEKAVKPSPKTPRSTLSTRRKKLPEYLAAISGAGIGFHLFAVGDVVAVRRGRRLHGIKDSAIWVEEERRLRGICRLRLPLEPSSKSLFWNDRWLQDVIAVMRICSRPYFTSPTQLEPLTRLRPTPLFDPTPLYHLIGMVISNNYTDDFSDDLSALAKRSWDPAVRKAAMTMAGDIRWLSMRKDLDPSPDFAFGHAEERLKFMARIRERAPDSSARVGYFREILLKPWSEEFEDKRDPIGLTLERCKQLGELERRGEWKGPSERELAYFHPDNEPPF